MDLQEATIAMASLMVEEAQFYREHLEGVKPDSDEEIGRFKKAIQQFEWLQSNTREMGNILAANPNFFDVMESWRVVINGTQGVDKESVVTASESDDVEDLFERCGSLATAIRSYIKNKGLIICDMSAGEDGWDIAVRCSEKNSRLLCEDFYRKYIWSINNNLITISRRFSGHCLPGLYNWDDAARILRTINQW